MRQYKLIKDKHGFICDPWVSRSAGMQNPQNEDTTLYECGWGKTEEEAIAHCKERNGWN